ncbi:TPM domain-containing protein, partial [Corynebacterium sp.]|uniref:TPM domain-containing protein n=1 Tax=Corynebacterium sp. TaxID=1720 RepID=UPI0037369F63
SIVSSLAAMALLSLTPAAVTHAAPAAPAAAQQVLQAQAPAGENSLPPSQLPTRVTDASGVLTPEQNAQLDAALQQFLTDHQKSIFLVYFPSFGDYTPMEWAEASAAANGGGNTLVLAVATQDRQYGLAADTSAGYWAEWELDDVEDAIFQSLVDSDWAGVGFAAVEDAFSTDPSPADVEPTAVAAEPAYNDRERTTTELSPSRPARNDGAWAGWLLLAMLIIAAVGALAIVRYVAQKKAAKKMAAARSVSPADPSDLSLLATTTLRGRAEEITAAIRASVLRGQEALDNAHAEFGIGRTRAFTRALDNADHVLQHTQRGREELFLVAPTAQSETSTDFSRRLKKLGYSLKRWWFYSVKLKYGSDVEQEPRTRIRLINLISDCGLAQEELDEQISAFADRRELLLHSHAHLDELTRRTVSLRTRLTKMSVVFSDLESRYAPALLSSISENVGKAADSLDDAEQQLQIGYELKAKPAGEQGRLSYIIRDTTRAVELTDDLLLSIQNAEDDLTIAHEGLSPLIKETTEEIKEAALLKERGASLYLPADWGALDTAAAEASIALAEAETRGATDPLGSYAALLEADTALEEQLRAAHTVIDAQKRQLTRLHEHLASAQEQIQVADNLIAAHQGIVKAKARTLLSNAQRLVERATQFRDSAAPLWQAAEYATPAPTPARRAAEQAQKDITAHQEKVEAEQEAARRAARERENENKAARKATGRAARWAATVATSSSSPSRRSSSRGGSFGGGSSTRSNRGSRGGGFSSRGGSF